MSTPTLTSLLQRCFSRCSCNAGSISSNAGRGFAASSRLPILTTTAPSTRCSGTPNAAPNPRRELSISSTRSSGHNRWSKIKHDKAKADAGLSKVRSYLSHEIAAAVKLAGPDPSSNPRLAALMAEAKRADFPKASMERAIARGQGISLSGQPLEPLTIEFMFPPSVGGIVEAETDNKKRTSDNVRATLTYYGASASPSSFLFDRRGRLIWDATAGGGVSGGAPKLSEEKVLESAIEAGALDIETINAAGEGDGKGGSTEYVVWTEVKDMAAVADQLASSLGVPAKSMQLVWRPKEDTKVEFQQEELDKIVATLCDMHEVQDVYLNTA